jgi:type VI secretion system protein ImpL
METFLNLLKKPTAIAALTVILAIVLLYLLTVVFKVAMVYGVSISIFILLIMVIILLYNRMKAIQKAGQIEKSINSQADEQMQSLSPEKRAEIEQFKKQLEAAIASLKNSKLGKGKKGKAALYALPWYMLIGPSAAGKTTAIQNSGLEFPFGKEGFRGVGGTRNCDWFFSTKAIFLDTAGRYVTQSEDKPEWFAFLDTLKKNRKRKPINGVMVAINIDEIINSEKKQLYEHARNIRQRIDELIENLGVNFPIYFVFTKCDLLQGFVEYYGDFSETERSQIWGATLTPHQQFDPNPKSVFENEFKKLSDRLFEIRTVRLSGPLKREQRSKVFLFPFQFKSLEQKLSYLIGEVFQPNPYQDNPIFRGFYFTSGTQEGVPLDLAIREIAKQFNLPESTGEESDKILETKTYFIKDLLNNVLIDDQDYTAGQTTSATKKISFARTMTISASVLALALFSLFTFMGYNGSSSLLKKISGTSNSFSRINWNGDLLKTFTKSDSLRSLIAKIKDGSANESFIHFGLDRSDKAYEPLEKLYFSRTENFFIQNIYNDIAKNLNNYANGQDYSGGDIYNYLKAYLLLGNERARLDTTQFRFLTGELSGILESRYLNLYPVASSNEKDSLKKLFNNYVSFFVPMLKDKNVYPVRNDHLLINLVRNRIKYKPNAETIYARMKQNGLVQFPNDITLQQAIGGQFSVMMNASSKVPFIFTQDGWKSYFKNSIDEESQNPGKDDWVLGKSGISSASSSSFNSEEMKQNLLNLYVSDYENTWLQFLQSIKYSNFESVPLAANNLKLLSDPVNSPLILILKVFSDQLQVITNIQSQDSAKQKLAGSVSPVSMSNNTFNEVNKYRTFINGSQGGSPNSDLNAVIAQYAVISGMLESIKGGQDLTKDYAVKVLSQRAVELPTAVQVIRGAIYTAPAFENLFIDPIKLTWKSILYDADQYLNLEWKAKISDTFNKTLANFFPFKNNGSDAPVQDFKDFFRPPDGILWSFFNSELSPFINKERWSVNQWEGQGLNVSNDFINALKKADLISGILFRNGDMSVSFKLKPQLPESSPILGDKPIVEQVYLYLDGVENYYKMGVPFWTDYTWPGNKGTPGARLNISIHGYGTSDTKSYDGDWALFKLFDDATVSRGGSSSQYVFNWLFKKQNEYNIIVSYIVNTNSSRNPFAANLFSSFNLPDKIY